MSQFNEPWQVRPYDLAKSPVWISSPEHPHGGWSSQSWDIIPANSERATCHVEFRSSDDDWSPTPDLPLAIAYRDRIIACVNACARFDIETVRVALAQYLERQHAPLPRENCQEDECVDASSFDEIGIQRT